jgi:hypothetical protein
VDLVKVVKMDMPHHLIVLIIIGRRDTTSTNKTNIDKMDMPHQLVALVNIVRLDIHIGWWY